MSIYIHGQLQLAAGARIHVHCLSLTANRNKEISSMCSLERNTNELLANMGRW